LQLKPLNADNQKLNAQYQTILVLWFALLVSQCLFVLLTFFLKPQLFHLDPAKSVLGSQPILVVAFAASSLFLLIWSFVWEKKFLNMSVDQQNVGFVQTALITACALCEAISLSGLLLAFAADYSYFFLFSGLGILGTLLHFPSRENILAASFKDLPPGNME